MACVNRIVNAAPMVVNRNTRSAGLQQVPVTDTPLPQHLPKFIIQAERGPLGDHLVTPQELALTYGSISLDDDGPYTNHQTIWLKNVASKANTAIVNRVSKGTKANFILSLDVLAADIDNLERTADGNIKLDANGHAIVLGTVPGHLVKWRLSSKAGWETTDLGTASPVAGSITNNSVSYPILEIAEEYPGQFGNNDGIKLYTPRPEEIDEEEMINNNTMPFFMSVMSRVNSSSTPSSTETIFGEKIIKVGLSSKSINRYGGRSYNIVDVLRDHYNNTTDTRYNKVLSPFQNNIYLYEDNVQTLSKMFMQAEVDFLSTQPAGFSSGVPTDLFTSDLSNGEEFLFNIMGGEDHTGIPYYTFAFDEGASVTDSVILSPLTTLYCRNGLDNNMSVTEYEREVRKEIIRYRDCSDTIQDLARHPESIFYDSGFSYNTKKELTSFIAQRPDTVLVLQTHEDTTNIKGWVKTPDPLPLPDDWVVPAVSNLTKSQELSVGSALRTRLLLQPESLYFGTPTMRGIIFTNSGKLRNRTWSNRVGFSYYLAGKAADYMGASNGRYKPTARFFRAPGNIIDDVTDVNSPWIPADTRIRYWDTGLNFPLTYDMSSLFMPALQTVHPDDTAPINSFVTAMSIAYLYKISYMAWREFSGNTDLSGEELVDEVNKFVERKTRGIFDGQMEVTPRAFISTDNEIRGYSWTLLLETRSGTMDTVMELEIESRRFEDIANGIGG